MSRAIGRREHDFVEKPGGFRECRHCPKTLSPGEDALPLWPGPRDERSELERGSAPDPVSDRRDEKRRSRAVRGPLCDAVRGVPCAVPDCDFASDPAHVRSVGAGFGDFIRVDADGRWYGNVVNLCRPHHRFLDGEIGGGGSPEAFYDEFGIDVHVGAVAIGDAWMEHHGLDPESPIHPYRQLEKRTEGESDG